MAVTEPAMYQVQTLGPDRERLQRLCRSLVDARLIACGQVLGPVRSVYRWREAVEEVEEWLALMKTSPQSLDAVVDAIRADHVGELPEIVATPFVHGLNDYLAWVAAESAGGKA